MQGIRIESEIISDVFEGSTNKFFLNCQTDNWIEILVEKFELTVITENNTIQRCHIKFRLPYLYIIEELQPFGILADIRLEEKQIQEISIGFVQTEIIMTASQELLKLFRKSYPTIPSQSPVNIFAQNNSFHEIRHFELVDFEFHVIS